MVLCSFFHCRILYELRFNITARYYIVKLENINIPSLMLDLMKIRELNQRSLDDNTHRHDLYILCFLYRVIQKAYFPHERGNWSEM